MSYVVPNCIISKYHTVFKISQPKCQIQNFLYQIQLEVNGIFKILHCKIFQTYISEIKSWINRCRHFKMLRYCVTLMNGNTFSTISFVLSELSNESRAMRRGQLFSVVRFSSMVFKILSNRSAVLLIACDYKTQKLVFNRKTCARKMKLL